MRTWRGFAVAVLLGPACSDVDPTVQDPTTGVAPSTSSTSSTPPPTGETTQDPPTSTTAAATTTSGGSSTDAPTTATTTDDPDTTTPDTTTTGVVCGDGNVDPGEQCDDGPANADDHSCTADCTTNVCGDGKLGPGEGCDDGNDQDGDGCSNACALASCGDGKLDPGEACDDGDGDNTDACTMACTAAACGDGFLQPDNGEACDDGADNGPGQACKADCAANVCGDGDVGPGEACDDGNPDDADGCTTQCALTTCGNHILEPGEECDNGNNNGDTKLCSTTCKLAKCGDGLVQTDVGEKCDDGNQLDEDECYENCTQIRDIRMVRVGDHHSCAVLTGNKIKCWGLNDQGQLGIGDTATRGDQPGEMAAALPYVDLDIGVVPYIQDMALGSAHACVLLGEGTVKCWGGNAFGQLGLGDTANRGDQPGEMGINLPTLALGIPKVTRISAAGATTCVVSSDQKIKCWGRNLDGILGLGDTANRGDQPGEMGANLPFLDLGAGLKAVTVRVGGRHACAWLGADAGVKCWGAGGLLGLGDLVTRGDQPGEMGDALPIVSLPLHIASIDAGADAVCVRLATNDNTGSRCWGANGHGQLGLGDTADRGDQPGEMGANLPMTDVNYQPNYVHLGLQYACYARFDWALCWGRNDHGQLGIGSTEDVGDEPNEMGAQLVVTMVDDPPGIRDIALNPGASHACAVVKANRVKCWGRNPNGELGLGDTEDRGDDPDEMYTALPRVKLITDAF